MTENYRPLRLFTPGPTPVPPEVLRAVAAPQPHHKSREFRALLRRIAAGLQEIFQTTQPVLPLTCSGTGGVEAAMLALHRPGDEAIVINNGRFSARWKTLLEMQGVYVREVAAAWGQVVPPEEIAGMLRRRDADAVWLVHSETSTGVLLDLEGVCRAVRAAGSRALVCADCITSIGVHDVPFDAWGMGAAVGASQKAFMSPPGLAFVALSGRAWELAERPNRIPAMYLDLPAAKKHLEDGLTIFTPAVNLLSGLDVALELMRCETLPAIIARHAGNAREVRRTVTAAGFDLLAGSPSNAVTVAKTLGFGERLVEILRDRFEILVENGQDQLRNEAVRIGHLGWYSNADIAAFCADFRSAAALARPKTSVSLLPEKLTSVCLVLASNNRHKADEITAIFAGLAPVCEVKILTLAEAGIGGITIEETGKTLEENACIKAATVWRLTGLPALADDTGLEVAALGGAPGVRSARYAGAAANDAENREKLLKNLENTGNRTAQFRTVLCLVDGVRTIFAEGVCAGVITRTEMGLGGFGYDCLFVPDGADRTFAEMPAAEKNDLSHRGRAAQALAAEIVRYLT